MSLQQKLHDRLSEPVVTILSFSVAYFSMRKPSPKERKDRKE